MLIHEADDGKTNIEYDRPSSLFGQFGDERVSPMAAALDQKLEDLAAAATPGDFHARNGKADYALLDLTTNGRPGRRSD